MTRRLIVTADDFGAALAVNEAVERAHVDGILTAASLMVGAPAAADAVARAKRLPKLGVGLHLVLVEGKPMLPPDQVPDLIGADDHFRTDMVRFGTAIAFRRRVCDQLRAEMEAQFAAFAATGLPLDHVNAHKHFHLHPVIAALIIEIGARYGLRAARAPIEPVRLLRQIEPVRIGIAGHVAAPYAKWLGSRFRRNGIAIPDNVLGLAWSGAMTRERVLGLIQRLPEGLTELYTHPATDDHYPGHAPGYRYGAELDALTDASVSAEVAARGIALGSFATFTEGGDPMSFFDRSMVPPTPQAPPPDAPIRRGSEAHLALMCRMLLDTHDPYKPALIDWPTLEPETQARITGLPIWDMAVQTEGRTGLFVKTFGETVTHPLLKAAVEMDAFEEQRHKTVLADMVGAYGIVLEPEPAYIKPKDPEWAFMRSGYSECIDSFFGFGLFKIAKDTGFFPEELIDTFEPVMREEGRHILFFVNWVAWWRRNMPIWRRPYFELKVLAVWLFLIGERMSMAKGMTNSTKAEENNFTLNGSKELGVEIEFPELAAICLAENDRRLAVYDQRLIRPKFVPWAIRTALKLMGKGQLARPA